MTCPQGTQFWLSQLFGAVLLATNGSRPRMLLNILLGTGQPHTEEFPAPKIGRGPWNWHLGPAVIILQPRVIFHPFLLTFFHLVAPWSCPQREFSNFSVFCPYRIHSAIILIFLASLSKPTIFRPIGRSLVLFGESAFLYPQTGWVLHRGCPLCHLPRPSHTEN